jgi:hypothetical protein
VDVLICLDMSLDKHPMIELLPRGVAHTAIEAINPLPKASLEGRKREHTKQILLIRCSLFQEKPVRIMVNLGNVRT